MLPDLEPNASDHLVAAIDIYKKLCARNGLHVPAQLLELQRDVAGKATSGHERPNFDRRQPAEKPLVRQEEMLLIEEASQYLRISVRTARRRIADGQLPAIRFGRSVRIRRDDLDAFLTAHRKGPQC